MTKRFIDNRLKLAFIISAWIDGEFNLPKLDFPSLPVDVGFTPQSSAAVLREEWDLGYKPIDNMIHLLESKGVRVFSLQEDTNNIDSFSFWENNKAYCFINNYKSSESSRFDTARELGHLVMNKNKESKYKTAEREADDFAYNFLMPEEDVKAYFSNSFSSVPRVCTLEHLVNCKKRWKVSLSALNYRLYQLKIFPEWHYRNFCIQISRQGFRTKEPESIKREKSLVFEKVFTTLWREKKKKSSVAKKLGIIEEEFDAMTFL